MDKAPCDLMREARERAKKTQAQIADELGVTQPAVHKWESGDGVPRNEDLRRVAAVYGLDPKRFIAAVIVRAEAKAS